MDMMALAIEMFHGFRADETAGTGNQNCLWLHLKSLLLPSKSGRLPILCVRFREFESIVVRGANPLSCSGQEKEATETPGRENQPVWYLQGETRATPANCRTFFAALLSGVVNLYRSENRTRRHCRSQAPSGTRL